MSSRLRRFWIQVTADRKRFGMLCAAAAVGLLLWGRLIVVSQPPRMALAGDAEETASGRSGQKKSGGSSGGEAADNSKSAKAVGSRVNRSPIAVELFAKPSHDPFVISPLYFPKPTPIAQPIQQLPKLVPEPVEDSVQVEARLVAHLRALADKMTLEAAIGNSMAVIDGRKYRVGETIVSKAGSEYVFKLVEVRQRSVVLECEGRQLELPMATPGS